MSRIYESCHTWMSLAVAIASRVAYEWVMSHMNKSRHIWIMYESWHVYMSHVTHEWVWPSLSRGMLHMNKPRYIWISHVTYEWVMARIYESCHTRMSLAVAIASSLLFLQKRKEEVRGWGIKWVREWVWAVGGGGRHIYIYIHTHIYIYIHIYTQICVYVYM